MSKGRDSWTLSPDRHVRRRLTQPFSTASDCDSPLTDTVNVLPRSGVAAYSWLSVRLGMRIFNVNSAGAEGSNVIATSPCHGYSVSWRMSSDAPARSGTVTRLSTKWLRYSVSRAALVEYIRSLIAISVRGMLPTQHGQACQGYRGRSEASGF